MLENIWTEMPAVREWKRVDAKRFNDEIVPLNRPVVMRGLVNHWPAVAAGRESPQALAELVRHCRVSISRSGRCRSANW